MQKLPRILTVLSFAATAALTAQTDTPGREDGDRGPHRHRHGLMHLGHPIVRAIDTDGNRELSADELANASASLRTLDANTDGTVSAGELRPVFPAGKHLRRLPPPDGTSATAERPAGTPERKMKSRVEGDESTRTRPVDPVMLALDANGDRSLSADEIARASASLTALDANKDGKLTFDELRPLPPTAVE